MTQSALTKQELPMGMRKLSFILIVWMMVATFGATKGPKYDFSESTEQIDLSNLKLHLREMYG